MSMVIREARRHHLPSITADELGEMRKLNPGRDR
jgi:hypothetical protein